MRYLGTLLLVCLIGNVDAQNRADSLEYYYQNSKDTVSLNRLINFCFIHIEEIPDEAFRYSKLALDKSKELSSKACEARSITNLGAIEAQRGNYPSALKYYMESLAIWEGLKMPRGILLNKNNIAQVYGYLKNTALEYRFLKEAESVANQYSMEAELGLIKTNLSVFYTNKGDFRKAFDEQKEAIVIHEKINNLSLASIDYSNAGASLFYLNKIDSAILYYRRSKETGEKIHSKKAIALSWANLAEAFQTKGQIDTAVHYYTTAVILSKEIGLKDILLFSYDQLAAIYKKNGDYPKAIQYIELKQQIKDSILNSNATKQLSELQTKYDTDIKNLTIIEQKSQINNQKLWISALIVAFVLLIVVVYLLRHRNKLKQEADMLNALRKTEDMATKAVLVAEENERKRIALDLHDGIGQMISVAKMSLSAIAGDIPFVNAEQKSQFEKAIVLVDESCSEVRAVSHNMMPNALIKTGLAFAVKNFLDNLNEKLIKINLYTAGLEERLDSNIEAVLYRVIQESVNNVIKHAQASQLDISLVSDKTSLSVTIEDNGIGFNKEEITNHDGIGLKNIQSRVTFLKGTVEWDSQKGKGTVVVINIPLSNAVIK